jgi:hypothetical protein
MGMLVIGKDLGVFLGIKRNGIELSTDTILEENLVQSAFHQTRAETCTFQEDKTQAQIYTGVAYQDDIECF